MLKLDGIMNWSWLVALWPIWILVVQIIAVYFGLLVYSIKQLRIIIKNKTWNQDSTLLVLLNSVLFVSSFSLAFSLISGIISLELESHSLYNYSCFFLCESSVLFIITGSVLNKHLEKIIFIITTDRSESSSAPRIEENPQESITERDENELKKPKNLRRKTIPKYVLAISSTYFIVPNEQFFEENPHLKKEPAIKCLTSQEAGEQFNYIQQTERYSNILSKPIKKIAQESLMCSICLDNISNTVLLPCGHSSLCFICSLEICKETICHICRKEVNLILKIKLIESNIFGVTEYLNV